MLGLQHGLQLCALQQVALQLGDHLPDLLQQLRGRGMVGQGLQGERAMFFHLREMRIQTGHHRRGGVSSTFYHPSHQIPEVAEGVSGQLHDALREAAFVADEAGEDGGQTMASAVQHHRGGGPLHRHLGAAAVGSVAGEEQERVIRKLSGS